LLHLQELRENWNNARNNESVQRIAPLE